MFSLCHFSFSWVCFFVYLVFFFSSSEKVAGRSSSNVSEMDEVHVVARKKQVVKCWDEYVSVNVNIMRKVRDKRKRKKHRDVGKAAMAFSRGVPSNVLVERTQSNGSNAINISLFVLFTSTSYMFYRSSTSLGPFFCLFRTRKVDYNFSGLFYLF